MTSVSEISEWFDRGVSKGASFMIVACDTYDWGDFPAFVSADDDLQGRVAYYSRDMLKVMEVYDLRADKGSQLRQRRCRADLVPKEPTP